MMKFIKVICLVFALLIVLTGCGSKHIKEISFGELKTMMDNKETFAIYIGNEDCPHCVSYKPTLEDVLDEYDIDIYHLDNSKLSESESSKLVQYINITGTPTIAFITNGEEESTLDRIVGETSREDTIEKFKLNGYIK